MKHASSIHHHRPAVRVRHLAIALALSPLTQAGAADSVQVMSGPSEPVREWVRSVETADIETLARMHPASTITYPPDAMVVSGTDDILAGYRGLFTKYQVKAQVSDARYVVQGGLVASWGLYTLVLTPRDGGSPVSVNGRFSDLAQRVGGQWQYIVDHASLPTKP